MPVDVSTITFNGRGPWTIGQAIWALLARWSIPQNWVCPSDFSARLLAQTINQIIRQIIHQIEPEIFPYV